MIDTSANISVEIFNKQLDVIQEILKEVQSSSDLTMSPNNLQIGEIGYSSDIRFNLYLNQTHDISTLPQYFILNQENVVYERIVKKAMDFLQKTVFHTDHGARSNSRKIVIFLVTDLVDPNLFAPLKQNGTTVIAIGINQNMDDDVHCGQSITACSMRLLFTFSPGHILRSVCLQFIAYKDNT